MQVTTANFRAGGIGSAPLSNVAAYCSLARANLVHDRHAEDLLIAGWSLRSYTN